MPGNPSTGRAPSIAEHHRLAGPHGDLPEIELGALVLERLLDEIEFTHRCATGRDQQIGAAARRRCARWRSAMLSRAMPRLMGAAPAGRDHGRQADAVGGDDLRGPQRFARMLQFIAGR